MEAVAEKGFEQSQNSSLHHATLLPPSTLESSETKSGLTNWILNAAVSFTEVIS